MHDSPRGSSKTLLLVVLLLGACYIADWSDDYYGYWVSTRYSTFHLANGPRPPLSGGGGTSSPLMQALAARGFTGQPQLSALESVFGPPLGTTPRNATDSAPSRMSAMTSSLDTSTDASDNNSLERGLTGNSSAFGSSNGRLGLGGRSGSSSAAGRSSFSLQLE